MEYDGTAHNQTAEKAVFKKTRNCNSLCRKELQNPEFDKKDFFCSLNRIVCARRPNVCEASARAVWPTTGTLCAIWP
jgi:hypothetical protein